MIAYQSTWLEWHFYNAKRFNGTALITVLILLTEKHCLSQAALRLHF